MPVNSDFSDLFCALNAAEARYLIVGGYAFSYHAEPRYTKTSTSGSNQRPPTPRHIVTSIDGVAFEDGWHGRVESTYGEAAILVIGRRELILNKIASGRPQDVADVARLNRGS